MCGLLGAFFPHPVELSPSEWEEIARASQSLAGRGPDGQGWAIQAGQGLVQQEQLAPVASVRWFLHHRLLQIADHSERARQPFVSPDAQRFLSYNGELYGYRRMRAELIGSGAEFASDGDTEVFMALLETSGDLPPAAAMQSMFAYCLVNLKTGLYTLARDPFGIKPLYFQVSGGVLRFASTLGALIQFQAVGRKLHFPTAVDYLLTGLTDHASQTMVEGVRQLPPGCYLRGSLAQPGHFTLEKYWRPRLCSGHHYKAGESKERLAYLIKTSVRDQSEVEVPLGLGFSGGLDSSAILFSIPEDRSRDLTLLTYSEERPELNELSWARAAAAERNLTPVAVRLTGQQLRDDLSSFVRAQGEPCGGPSHYAQFCVYRKAAQLGLKVVLEGHGGDELLGGYPQMVSKRLASLLLAGRLGPATRLLLSAAGGSIGSLLSTSARALETMLPDFLRRSWRYRRPPTYLSRDCCRDYVAPTMAWDRREPDLMEELGRPNDFLRFALLKKLLSGMYAAELRTADRSAMAHGIENRVPFLTTNLVEFCSSLPEDALIDDGGVTKSLMREALAGLVPAFLLQRPDKLGFSTSDAELIASAGLAALVRSTVRDNPSLQSFLVLPDKELDHQQVWRLANFVVWCQELEVSL